MAFMVAPTDVLTLTNAARRLDPDPLSLAGKLVGFGADEQKSGIPGWAWLTVGLGIGAALAWKFAPGVKARLRAFE